MVLMSTMKAYFDFTCCITCGIPQVTLEGEKEDWEALLKKLEKLKEYGLETIAWYHLLVPVISRFVRAFEEPESRENIDFWGKVAHHESGGSGPSYYTGWITAFCVFNEETKGDHGWVGPRLNKQGHASDVDPTTLSAAEFWKTYTPNPQKGYGQDTTLSLDSSVYHHIDSSEIPAGYTEVDVKVIDNGDEFPAILVAGMVGSEVRSSGDKELSGTGASDTVRCANGWWMAERKSDEEMAEEKRIAAEKEKAQMDALYKKWGLNRN